MKAGTTRRGFLKRSSRLVTAGLVAPTIVRSGALKAEGRPAANERVGVGFIGVGGRGANLLGHYAENAQFPCVAVCDVDQELREKAAKRLGPEAGKHNDYRELLDRKDVDAVVIAVPDHWHAITAIQSCEAGKDVYCEKPLSLTVRQGRAMVDAARRYGSVFQTGSQQRSQSNFREACELVRSGRLGKIESIRVSVWGPSQPCNLPAEPVPPGLDWNQWLGPAPWRPFHHHIHPANWRRWREYSGGQTTDWGAHHLDIVQWALGMDDSGPVKILPPGKGKQYITYEYASGVTVQCGSLGDNDIEFVGTDGTIKIKRGSFKAEPAELAHKPLGSGDVQLYRSPGQTEDWQRCLSTRKKPNCDVEIGHRSAVVCHLGNIAVWTGRALSWNPVEEKIIGDEQASRWLDRPQRAPPPGRSSW
jgi:predicted dehydrogenase